jgi:thiamine kinase-like enzyme
MAGSADRETWQDLAELRAQIAEDALDGDKDRYPTDQEWESSLQRAERVKKKHASLFDRLAQEDDESADDRRTDYSETLEQQAARQRERVDELEAEVERLRGTLQKIANVPVFGRQAKPSKSTIRDWARNALDGAGDDDE